MFEFATYNWFIEAKCYKKKLVTRIIDLWHLIGFLCAGKRFVDIMKGVSHYLSALLRKLVYTLAFGWNFWQNSDDHLAGPKFPLCIVVERLIRGENTRNNRNLQIVGEIFRIYLRKYLKNCTYVRSLGNNESTLLERKHFLSGVACALWINEYFPLKSIQFKNRSLKAHLFLKDGLFCISNWLMSSGLVETIDEDSATQIGTKIEARYIFQAALQNHNTVLGPGMSHSWK